jgi:hypothetical protein
VEFAVANLKLHPISVPVVTLGILLLLLLQPGHNATGTPSFDPHAYLDRGDQVEKRYNAYSKRLAQYYAALTAAVKVHAPDLLANLQPRKPILHGYHVLPRIVSEAPAEMRAGAAPVAYSWPWTDRLIDRELRQIIRSELELQRASETAAIDGRAILERLALEYGQQSDRLQNIQAHVQYNRLWQAAIAADPGGYDRRTALFNDVIERQAIIDRLNRLHGGLKTSRVHREAPLGIAELTTGLRKRKTFLTRRIDQALGAVQTPGFVKLENLGAEWVLRVPLFTDIDSREYVAAVEEIIENTWRLEDGRNHYRVELAITHVSGESLYTDQERPGPGQKIDLSRHLERFPSGAAILTTGARTTHVRGRAIVLGPQAIASQVVAHEFGHILGFRDRYVRAYKNLGKDGFQVMEVVADRDDIMAATVNGTVRPGHFLKLRDSSLAGETPAGREPQLIRH